ARRARLQKEAGAVRTPLIHLVVVDLDRQVTAAVRFNVQRRIVAARSGVCDAGVADRVVPEVAGRDSGAQGGVDDHAALGLNCGSGVEAIAVDVERLSSGRSDGEVLSVRNDVRV